MEISKEKHKIKDSILVISTGFLVLYLFFEQNWAIGVSLGVSLAGIFSEKSAYWIHYGWMKIAMIMGYFMSRVLLSAVFFLFLTPIALLYRLTRKKTASAQDSSFYFERNHTYQAEDLKNVW